MGLFTSLSSVGISCRDRRHLCRLLVFSSWPLSRRSLMPLFLLHSLWHQVTQTIPSQRCSCLPWSANSFISHCVLLWRDTLLLASSGPCLSFSTTWISPNMVSVSSWSMPVEHEWSVRPVERYLPAKKWKKQRLVKFRLRDCMKECMFQSIQAGSLVLVGLPELFL